MPDKQHPNVKIRDLMDTTFGSPSKQDQQARIVKYLRENQTHADYNNRWAAMLAAS